MNKIYKILILAILFSCNSKNILTDTIEDSGQGFTGEVGSIKDLNVELYSLEGEGHAWYSKNLGHDLSSSELIWKFFKDQQ